VSGAFSNVDRVLWPHAHFTKGQMLEYYEQIAPVLLPHIRGRPLTLRRFPHGVEEHGWYQTNCRGAPTWMRVAEVPGRGDALFRMCVVDDVRSLLWVVNLGTIELHPFLARADAPNEPDYVVFDLDPGPDAGLTEACAVAVRIRDLVTRALVKNIGIGRNPRLRPRRRTNVPGDEVVRAGGCGAARA
jgi:bifunctional non-homologous end joining protein LigD